MRSKKPLDVSILVVSYNTRAMTLAALDSVVAQTREASYELVVVDNASDDGSADAIADHPSKPRLIRSRDNLGFARANNLAARHAEGEYLLLLNPDTVVLDHAIDRLVAFARKRPDAGIWGGRTLFADHALNASSCWGRMTPWNLFCRASGLTGVFPRSEIFNGEAYGGWRRDCIRRVDIVSGCFFLIKRQLWERLEGFDPLFFMYGEEADLCLRARRFGARPLLTPDATIIHYGGASERARTAKMVKLLAAKASLIERHFSPGTRRLGLLLHKLWPMSRWFFLANMAPILGSQRLCTAARTWQEIWNEREKWQHGYPAARRGTSTPGASEPAFDHQPHLS